MKLHSITIEHGPFKFDISINAWSEHRGCREIGTGIQLEPDEQAGWEIDSVTVTTNGSFDFDEIEELNYSRITELVEEYFKVNIEGRDY